MRQNYVLIYLFICISDASEIRKKNELNLCSEIVVAFSFENLSIGVRRGRGELYGLRLEDVEMKNNTEKK